MICPKCHHDHSKVLDSRPSNKSIRRRRECSKCGYRFSTLEEIKILDLYVEKRNGKIETFVQDKLEYGIRKAFNKRRVDNTKIAALVQKVVEDILATDKNPIKTTKIGNLVLKNLRKVDEAAYICFWAMFGNFESLEEFKKLLKDFDEG